MCLHDKNMSFKVLGDNPSVVLELGVSPKSWVFVFSSVKWVLVKVPEIMFMKEPDTWQVNAQERRFSLLLLSIPESKSESGSILSNSLRSHGLYSPWNSLGQNTGVGRQSLLQGIFPAQGSNSGFWHCRWIIYQLSHQRSPICKKGQQFLLKGSSVT